MDLRSKSDLISGACIATFGIYVIYEGSRLPYVSEFGPGPGFFPFWIGIGLLVFPFCLIWVNSSPSRNETQKVSPSWIAGGRALGGWVGLMVAVALFSFIGFGLSFVLLTMFLIVALDRRPALLALGVGVGLAVGFHLVFAVALGVSLPAAPWGF